MKMTEMSWLLMLLNLDLHKRKQDLIEKCSQVKLSFNKVESLYEHSESHKPTITGLNHQKDMN